MSSTVIAPPADVPWGAAPSEADSLPKSRLHALWRGRTEDAAWVRPAVVSLLALTAVLYLWGLGASGWANDYYSAAVQAGTRSWKAFLFGSTDASNFITVDKSPASLWPMEISARIFGVNSWSILVPQALMGVATVGVVYATVRRWFTPEAGLIAGAVVAFTPVAALMFRYNNPDAMLVLLLTIGAYAMTRALEDGRTRWLVLAGGLVGFAFLAKELQAFLVLPAFGLVYLICGPPRLGRRVAQLFALGVAMLLAAGWWVALIELWPASDRPYVGGSQNNSFFNVLFGYNGFGRLTGDESGSVGGGGAVGGTGRWGPTGWTRMFNDAFGGQISWLLPAALILTVAGLVFTWKRPRTDRTRAALILWGATLFVTGAVFSLSKGIIHEYYAVALGPAIGALVGIGIATFWPHRDEPWARILLGVVVAVSAFWANALLERTPDWNPWLRTVVLVGGCALAFTIAFGPALRGRAAAVVGGAAVVVVLAAPAAYTLSTVSSLEGWRDPARRTRFGRAARVASAAVAPAAPVVSPLAVGRRSTAPAVAASPVEDRLVVERRVAAVLRVACSTGRRRVPRSPHCWRRGVTATGGSPRPSEPTAPRATSSRPTRRSWPSVASTAPIPHPRSPSSSSSSPMATSTTSSPAVAVGVGGGGGGGFGGGGASSTSSQIRSWVENNFDSTTVDGVTVYDLTSRTV